MLPHNEIVISTVAAVNPRMTGIAVVHDGSISKSDEKSQWGYKQKRSAECYV